MSGPAPFGMRWDDGTLVPELAARDILCELVEAFEGRPTEYRSIPVGVGICGKAVAEMRDLNVPDVSQAAGYLACSVETKSELVVLIRRHQEILGQIDVDSDVPQGFSQAEESAVREVADALAVLL